MVSVPAADGSQGVCTGLIADFRIPHNLPVVVGGADDDFHSRVRQFTQGESVVISRQNQADLTECAEFRVIRPAKELFSTSQYPGQAADLKKMGDPYEDVGQVKVIRASAEGVVAKITSSCEPMLPGDILIRSQPRVIPQYVVSQPLDHFTPLDKHKVHGKIAACQNNFGVVGQDTIVYVNFGERDGTLPGRRLRIYKPASSQAKGSLPAQNMLETIGEAIVLSVETRSCVAKVVASYREIAAGDSVELE